MNLSKALRAILTTHMLLIFVQFTFAGMMIGGNHLTVNLHGATGLLLVLVALIQMSLVVATKMKSRCPAWLVVANAGIIAAELIEAICGHFHILALHVPLALAISGGVMRQLSWAVRQAPTTSQLSNMRAG